MVDEVSAKYLVCRIKISSAEQVLEPASCERLVLFGHLFLLFLRRPHWGARAQSSARRGLDTLPLDGLPRTPSRRSSQNTSTRQLVVRSPYAVCADTGMLTPHARIAVPLSPQRRIGLESGKHRRDAGYHQEHGTDHRAPNPSSHTAVEPDCEDHQCQAKEDEVQDL